MITVVAVAVSGLLALLGFLFTRTRDETGRLTTTGWWTLAMLIISCTLNTLSALNARNESLTIARELRRDRYKLEEVTVRFSAVLPTKDRAVRDYARTLEVILDSFTQGDSRATEDIMVSSSSNGALRELRLTPESIGYPAEGSHPAVFEVINRAQIKMTVYRRPVQIVAGQPQIYSDGQDLRLASMHSVIPGSPPIEGVGSTSQTTNIIYDIEASAWELQTPYIRMPASEWRFATSNFSALDLVGAQLVIDPFQSGLTSYGDDGSYDKIRSLMRMSSLFIELFPGRFAWFDEADWLEHQTERGFPVYELRFPESEEELLEVFGLH